MLSGVAMWRFPPVLARITPQALSDKRENIRNVEQERNRKCFECCTDARPIVVFIVQVASA